MVREARLLGAVAPVRTLVDGNALHRPGQPPREAKARPIDPNPPRVVLPESDDDVLVVPELDEPEPERKNHEDPPLDPDEP